MKLSTEKGEIALPEDFSFEIEVNNPFFSDEGTASVPATLPPTGNNLDILGHPERPGKARRHIRTIRAVLQHNVFQRNCNLVTEGAGIEDGISISLAFSESEMYSDIKGKNLKDIFKDESLPLPTGNPNLFLSMLFAYCFNSRTPPAGWSDYRLFPVALEKDDNKTPSMLVFNTQNGMGDTVRDVKVPPFYGITPFILLHVMVTKTFALCGYNVIRNDLSAEPFASIVVVNNCADSLCRLPSTRLSDLVPSVTMEELIVWLKDKFGATVYMRHNNISIVLMQNTLGDVPDMDITTLTRNSPSFTYPASSRVVLGCSTDIDSAEPVAETMQELREQHDVIRQIGIDGDPKSNCIVLNLPLGKYYAISSYKPNPISYRESLVGTNCFRYDRDNSEDTEKHEAEDRFLPEIDYEGELMPYIGDRVHYNTSIAGEENETDQPLQICYALWDENTGHWFGSTQPYTRDAVLIYYTDGNMQKPYPALTPDGLYDLCWKAYNELLLNSMPEVEAQIDFGINELLSLDMARPKLFYGQRVLIKALSYELSGHGITCGRCRMQLIQEYTDAIYDAPIVFKENEGFKWAIEDNYREHVDEFCSSLYMPSILGYQEDGVDDYTMDDAPEYTPPADGIVEKSRERFCILRYTEGQDSQEHTQKIFYDEYFISVYADTD